jgi:hypothetical protein
MTTHISGPPSGFSGVLPTPNAKRQSVPVKMPAGFQIANKINDFEYVSCETALIELMKDTQITMKQKQLLRTTTFLPRGDRLAQLSTPLILSVPSGAKMA